MKKFTFSFKSLLLAAGLLLGSANAWGAGYTRTLTDGLEVTGYKAKAFYDFQNNSPAVLPTEGDLRYRAYGSGGYWGLHNFGGGGRSGTATIPLASTDILVIQEYNSSYVTTINRGSENATLTASTGYRVFDITSTADDVTFSVPRYGGIVAAFVMEKDNTVKTGNYTINYKASSVTVKTVSGTDVAVGTVIPILDTFIEGGKKYNTDGGQASSLTIAEGDNNLDIAVTEAVSYTCTVNAKAGELLLASPNGSVYSGENVTVYYQKAYSNTGKWYFVDVNGSAPGYGVTFSDVTSNQTQDVTTYTLNNDVVYFEEAENMTIVGSWAADGAYLNWRSNGGAKRMAKQSYIYTSTIAPGVYDVTMFARNQRSAGDGTETLPIFLRDGDGNLTDLGVSFPGWARGGFEAAYSARIAIPDDGKDYSVVINNNTDFTSNLELDYVYLTKLPSTVPVTISGAGYATFSSAYPLDLTTANTPGGLEAYYVGSEGIGATSVSLTAINQTVSANEGILFKGTANATYNIPVVASGTALSENQLIATDGSEVGAGNFVFAYENGTFANPGFYTLTTGTVIAEGKAYLQKPVSSVKAFLPFDGTATGVEAPVAAEAEEEEILYNTAGQQVTKDYKGVVINQKGEKRFQK